jgi:hypothetical protein
MLAALLDTLSIPAVDLVGSDLVPQLRDKANARSAAGLGGCCYTHPALLFPGRQCCCAN